MTISEAKNKISNYEKLPSKVKAYFSKANNAQVTSQSLFLLKDRKVILDCMISKTSKGIEVKNAYSQKGKVY